MEFLFYPTRVYYISLRPSSSERPWCCLLLISIKLTPEPVIHQILSQENHQKEKERVYHGISLFLFLFLYPFLFLPSFTESRRRRKSRFAHQTTKRYPSTYLLLCPHKRHRRHLRPFPSMAGFLEVPFISSITFPPRLQWRRIPQATYPKQQNPLRQLRQQCSSKL